MTQNSYFSYFMAADTTKCYAGKKLKGSSRVQQVSYMIKNNHRKIPKQWCLHPVNWSRDCEALTKRKLPCKIWSQNTKSEFKSQINYTVGARMWLQWNCPYILLLCPSTFTILSIVCHLWSVFKARVFLSCINFAMYQEYRSKCALNFASSEKWWLNWQTDADSICLLQPSAQHKFLNISISGMNVHWKSRVSWMPLN
jgi:hypothetical protein